MCQPVMITDEWAPTKIHELTDQHTITLLGRELRVEYSVPAERGGDFYTLEAYGYCCGDVEMKDIVSFTLDKNTEVYARLN